MLQMVSYQNSSCIDCWPRVADRDHKLIENSWELVNLEGNEQSLGEHNHGKLLILGAWFKIWTGS